MPTHTDELARETLRPDEDELTRKFIAFLEAASLKRHPTGPVPRFNQGRAAGCADAELTVPDDLPPDLRVGLFKAPKTFRARVRFAHAASQSDTEKDVRGMSIQVHGVEGTNLTPGASTQDFILNSHPVMMVGASDEFLELLQANEAGGARRVLFFLAHPHAAGVALQSRQNHTSHLEISYWSTTPYLFGPGRAVKYIIRPASSERTPLPEPLTDTYLRERLVSQLQRGDAHFDLFVQFQTNARTMPIEDASVEWREEDSPYRLVARVRIPQQSIDGPNSAAACEQMSFNPWHALTEHRPLGNYNRARRAIYTALAAFRQAHA
jgi:hypothetical protein